MTKSRVSTAIRFPPTLHAALKRAAEERDMSINHLTVKAVEEFLPRLLPAAELSLTRPSKPSRNQVIKDGIEKLRTEHGAER